MPIISSNKCQVKQFRKGVSKKTNNAWASFTVQEPNGSEFDIRHDPTLDFSKIPTFENMEFSAEVILASYNNIPYIQLADGKLPTFRPLNGAAK